MLKGHFVIITGPRGSGKSTFLADLEQALSGEGWQCGGYYQPVCYQNNERLGYDLLLIGKQERRPLARRAKEGQEFDFIAEAFAASTLALNDDLAHKEIFFIDEAGFVEAGGAGHFQDIELLVKSERPAVIAAREETLPNLLARLPLEPMAIIRLPAEALSLEATKKLLTHVAHRPLEINWQQKWPAMVRARAAVPRPSTATAASDPWQRRAKEYDESAKNKDDGGLLAALWALLKKEDTFLDIGAGTGYHAVKVAEKVQKVLAIEPSAAMAAVLKEKIAVKKLKNIAIEAASWPACARPKMADVVFSSHVLYGQEEAARFILAMDRAAKRLAIISLALKPASMVFDALRRELWGISLPPSPTIFEALLLVQELGLNPRYLPFPRSLRQVLFGTDEESLKKLARRLGLPEELAELEKLALALPKVALKQEDGRYLLGESGPNGFIIWEPR